MIPELPVINDSRPADYVLIQNKWEIASTKATPDSVGKFRNDLDKLKAMRRKLKPVDSIIQRFLLEEPEEEIELVPISTRPISSKQPPIQARFGIPGKRQVITTSKPSNPLIDQTISVIKPTEWIDCISRESKRVFVKDNWIVARILLPPIAKDSIGLKRLP